MARKYFNRQGRGNSLSAERRKSRAARRRNNVSRYVDLGLERLEPRWVMAAPGDLDPTFSGDGLVVQDLGLGLDEEINATAVQSDGKILVAGITNTPGGADRDFMVARFNTDGTLDTSFGTSGYTIINMSGITPPANNVDDTINDIAIDSLGRIVVVGSASSPPSGGNTGFAIARLTASGQLDTTFSGDGKLITILQNPVGTNINSAANAVALQADGRIVVGGTANTPAAATHRDFIVARYNDDGSLDTTFDGDGYVFTDFDSASGPTADDNLFDIAVQSDGRIVAVGNAQSDDLRAAGSQEIAIARYNSNGSLDTTFGGGDGRVLTDIAPAAFSSQDTANAVAIEADGQIIVAGFASVRNSSASTIINLDFILGRYNSNGTLDATFAPSSEVDGTLRIDFSTLNDEGRGLILQPQPDGKYVVGGRIAVTGPTAQFGLARVLPNGQLDTTFNGDGRVQTSFPASAGLQGNDIVMQPDGKIVAAGFVQTPGVGGNRDIALARYESGLLIADAGGPYAVNEPGGSVVLTGSGTGSGTLSYAWDLDGDAIFGETGAGALNGDEVGQTVTYTALGLDGPDTKTVSLRITSSPSGEIATDSATINIVNVAPILAISGAADVDEGSSYTLNLSSFDPGPDTIISWTINWGDGIIETVSGDPSAAVHTYADGDNNYTISATATDEDGTFDSNTLAVAVNNVAPTLIVSGDASVSEGSSYTLNLSPSDPGADAITFWTINWGDGNVETVPGNPSAAAHTYADGDNNYTISATATDEDGTFDSNTLAVAVNNVAPTLTVSGDASVSEGSSYTLNLLPSDPGADAITSWTINWGDGNIETVSGDPSAAAHTYSDGDNNYTISATATDEDGTFDSNTLAIAVNNVAPTLTVNGDASVSEGSSYTLNLSPSDPGADAITSWTINWGDGNVENVPGNPSSAVHTYADGDNSYTISATATDEDGTFTAGNTVDVLVNNVDPTANAGGPYFTFDDTSITLNGSGFDVAGAVDPLLFAWDLDNNGTFETSGASAVFDPQALGFTGTQTRTVNLLVTDGDGGQAIATTTVELLGVGSVVIGGVLHVVGSDANDIVLITRVNNSIKVIATFNANNPVVFSESSVTEIQVRVRGGHDIVVTTPNVTKPMSIDGGGGNDLLTGGGARNVILGGSGYDILHGDVGDDVLLGGTGNDDLFGGSGNDVLVGGDGNDILNGGAGRDVVIGSQDEDLLYGGNDEDILIGGFTIHDANVAALDAIMGVWGSSASFNSRVAALTANGGLLQAGAAVFDDDDNDLIAGGSGRDLVFGDTNPWDGALDLIALQPLQDVLVAVN